MSGKRTDRANIFRVLRQVFDKNFYRRIAAYASVRYNALSTLLAQ